MRFRYVIILLTAIIITACSNNEENKSTENKSNPQQHKVTVQEVIQVTDYTYLRVTEDGKEYWMAAPKAEFKEGEVVLYSKAMEMKNFTSKELDRTFDSILFIDAASVKLGEGIMNQPQKPVLAKEDVKVEPVIGGITIEQIFSKPEVYSNRNVKVKGKVVKVNTGIMKRNWVHLQDGTKHKDDFDLTITTNENVKVGDIVIFEGKIVLNKDFGYGYSYKVLMEDAKAATNL